MTYDTIVLAPVAVFAIWLKFFGQVNPVQTVDPGTASLIGNAGIVGVLIWYLWYNTSKSYPRMLDSFASEQEKNRLLYVAQQEAQRVAFDRALESQRVAFDRALDAQRIHDAREQAELRTVMIEALRAMRVAVHDVRDTANQAIVASEVAVKKATGDSSGDSQKIPVIKPK